MLFFILTSDTNGPRKDILPRPTVSDIYRAEDAEFSSGLAELLNYVPRLYMSLGQ